MRGSETVHGLQQEIVVPWDCLLREAIIVAALKIT